MAEPPPLTEQYFKTVVFLPSGTYTSGNTRNTPIDASLYSEAIVFVTNYGSPGASSLSVSTEMQDPLSRQFATMDTFPVITSPASGVAGRRLVNTIGEKLAVSYTITGPDSFNMSVVGVLKRA